MAPPRGDRLGLASARVEEGRKQVTPERWQEVKKMLAAALERAPEQRRAYLDRACADPALRREVESLIAAHEQGDTSFMEQPGLGSRALKPGTKLGPYEILAHLGAGGMGVVYRARDGRLERDVAIKVLPPGLLTDDAARKRFRKEALALAKLNHPNIATVYDVGEHDGADYLVMECVPGQSLAEKLRSGSLPTKEVVSLGAQIAVALEEAHEHDIVHRDLKPGNIMVTPKGQAKVLDFGLSKLLAADSGDVTLSFAATKGPVGTLPYMAPEQLRGEPVDARTDIHALGAVLYEMAAGRRPFQEESFPQLTDAILHREPASLQTINPGVSHDLGRIVMRCLAKKREERYASASEVHGELEALQPHPKSARPWSLRLRQPAVAATLLAILIVVGALGIWGYVRASRTRWAEKEVLPRVAELVSSDRPFAALQLLHEADRYLPSSPEVVRLRESLKSVAVSIQTTPPGAEIYVRDYIDAKDDNESLRWVLLGTSPLKTNQLPLSGYHRVRAVKEGFEPVERTIERWERSVNLPLHTRDVTPKGMVWIPVKEPDEDETRPPPPLALPGFWIDKYEVTNREFKEFVDAGGYQERAYWKEPFTQNGQARSWEQAMAEFRDATGRPGPSTWQLGTYAEGTADFPVAGVSWYETAAYAEFAGKSLPTYYHWYRAARLGPYSDVLKASNFSGHGPAPVGSYSGVGPFGTYDMAGNVKEWVLNPSGDRRYILGGGWNEPAYTFTDRDARNPFDRSATFGFRCAKYDSELKTVLAGPVPSVSPDRRKDQPADDQAFRIYLRLHSYDKTDLKPAVESVDDSSPYWRMEKVTFQAAYGDERVIARLYLPKGVPPPYQVAVFFPGTDALEARNAEELQDDPFEFVIRSGRALMFPSYKGMLERGPAPNFEPGHPNEFRDLNLQWSKDLGRSLDYLETRPDIDIGKLAFCGSSLGAMLAPSLIAVEPRFKTAVLLSGGSVAGFPPEVDPWNFAPRVKIPVLMLNGRDDFVFPLETSQIPLFESLGTPAKDKRHVVYDGGHIALFNRPDLIKEVLDWLDRYLGPVKSGS